MRSTISTIIELLGAVAIAGGVGLLVPALGLVVLGLELVAVGYLMERN